MRNRIRKRAEASGLSAFKTNVLVDDKSSNPKHPTKNIRRTPRCKKISLVWFKEARDVTTNKSSDDPNQNNVNEVGSVKNTTEIEVTKISSPNTNISNNLSETNKTDMSAKNADDSFKVIIQLDIYTFVLNFNNT